MNNNSTNFSYDPKNGKYEGKNPTKESSDILRQILNHRKFVLVVTLAFSLATAIVFKTWWPVFASPLTAAIDYLKPFWRSKSP